MQLKHKQRIALSAYFFLIGFCFSTWTSRIPTVKSIFNYNSAQLSNVLLALPISSLIGLSISSWLVSRFDSRQPLLLALLIFLGGLVFIGIARVDFMLIAAVSIFSFFMRIVNIAMNTQAITLQKQYNKKINGSFHGLWSTGGIAGVGFSTLMIKLKVSMDIHVMIVAAVALLMGIIAYPWLLKNDRSTSGNKLIIGKPDPFIFYLGMLVFLAAVCEGGMFDWSGVYFKEVIGEEVFTLGYLIFMICMASTRFYSDQLVERFGMGKIYLISSVLIAAGILLAIAIPHFWTAMAGFCLVGFGTASVIPMTFTLAGTSKKYSAGMAISIVATYGIIGMLIGPPLIGYLAYAFNLRISFIAFILSGLTIIPISQLFFHYQKTSEKVNEL